MEENKLTKKHLLGYTFGCNYCDFDPYSTKFCGWDGKARSSIYNLSAL